jgi:hypothetical protein
LKNNIYNPERAKENRLALKYMKNLDSGVSMVSYTTRFTQVRRGSNHKRTGNAEKIVSKKLYSSTDQTLTLT